MNNVSKSSGVSSLDTPTLGPMYVQNDLIVKDRNILNELDNLHKSMLLLPRNQKLEDKFPELKEAYDSYIDLYRGLLIADKMANIHD
jgi:hypothetical protein